MAELQLNEAEAPPAGVGMRLRQAREKLGWSRAQLAARTKIPDRHLAAIESGTFSALPARTYAIGFTRSYAREVGLDEAVMVADLRIELDGLETQAPRTTSFEPGDPARIPAGGLAWIAALAALAVVIGVAVFWRSFYAPAMTLPPVKPAPAPAAPVASAPLTPAAGARPAATAAASPAPAVSPAAAPARVRASGTASAPQGAAPQPSPTAAAPAQPTPEASTVSE